MKPEHRLFYHKDNFPLLSRFQGNFFKPFQLFYRPDHAGRHIPDVELYSLCSLPFSDIFKHYSGMDGIPFSHLCFIKFYLRQRKPCIAKAIAERIEWFVWNIKVFGAETLLYSLPVRSSCGKLIVVDRHLAHTVRKTHGQSAGGVFFSRQHVHYSAASLRPGAPHHQHGSGLLADFPYIQGAAAEQHHHNIFIHPVYCPEKLHLHLRIKTLLFRCIFRPPDTAARKCPSHP